MRDLGFDVNLAASYEERLWWTCSFEDMDFPLEIGVGEEDVVVNLES
jgi:hypothetical protein